MTTPLLFGKRRPAAPAIAAQYVGTDTEMDPKDNFERTPCSVSLRRRETNEAAAAESAPAR